MKYQKLIAPNELSLILEAFADLPKVRFRNQHAPFRNEKKQDESTKQQKNSRIPIEQNVSRVSKRD